MALDTLSKRLEKKRQRHGPNDCWPWLGYINDDGEARVWVDAERGSVSVPRAIYLIEYFKKDKDIPEGYEALSCPILRDCSNPQHVSLVHRSEIADRILASKGLHRRLKRGKSRQLSDEQIRQIYLSTEPTSILARTYGVTMGEIANIRAGRRHREVTDALRPVNRVGTARRSVDRRVESNPPRRSQGRVRSRR